MYIFLDTNIFYSDLLLNKVPFKYLFSFVNNSKKHTLLLSKLVIEETENIRGRELDALIKSIEKLQSDLGGFTAETLETNLEAIKKSQYDLLKEVGKKTEDFEVIDYNEISQHEVVARALEGRKPFSANEKGYRDTLIWLSLLRNSEGREIAFISNNSSDFYNKNNKLTGFHQSLLEDIAMICPAAKITPYKSLYDFMTTHIKKDEHTIDHLQIADRLEEYAHHSAINFIEGFDNLDLSEYLENSIFKNKVSSVKKVTVVDIEGVEDRNIEWHSKISDTETLISYIFDLRRVIIEVEISSDDYAENKEVIDGAYKDIELRDGIACLNIFTRPYFNANIIFNHSNDSFTDFSVSYLWLRYATLGELTQSQISIVDKFKT
ncbi:PIN domain-containing protein [Deefgea tanakiae]|uniref:PIN domain-containing protein n=1 Tax=Deefgea tanakiae TaxID=2865840 RepID=A0ABX8Z5E2_9NEIS|nr:PIN domain-containing protein [Deefgea tanakiae]QZA77781.1 PIN domain-containing protein [Deefgea tanakiae]